ncbi:hypothetical protein KKF32_04440 [Patescibacteria group bacterium]|nr:hypothetical protein [Patescibacteria group bacterium]
MNKETVEQVVLESGLWDQGRKSTHGFILSPSVFEISQSQREKFETIGNALYHCLAGLSRIAVIAWNPWLGRNKTWGMISRALRIGIPKIYYDLQALKPNKVPSICKVDFMEATDGRLLIAEIDGHNPHGLGYSTLGARIRRVVAPQAQVFPGVATMLAEETKRIGNSNYELTLLYADQERFYLPEFKILQNELAKLGIKLTVIAESEFNLSEQIVKNQLFVYLPFLYHNTELNETLAKLYLQGEIDFLIPPKPFLGSKTILALLRNDEKNKELEAILHSQIPATMLELLRHYIPETYLIRKSPRTDWESFCQKNGGFVLKEAISYGMKGMVFSNEEKFPAILEKACSSYYRFILQREVINCSRSFQFFENDGTLQQDEWYMRITVHYSIRQVADITVTARRDKKVHGALDCLQLGTIIV